MEALNRQTSDIIDEVAECQITVDDKLVIVIALLEKSKSHFNECEAILSRADDILARQNRTEIASSKMGAAGAH